MEWLGRRIKEFQFRWGVGFGKWGGGGSDFLVLFLVNFSFTCVLPNIHFHSDIKSIV